MHTAKPILQNKKLMIQGLQLCGCFDPIEECNTK